MAKNIYKYIGASTLEKVFAVDGCVTVKCSYPKDFNDPYELFLAINVEERPEYLAYYADAVGQLDQIPTTCFSLSPAVVPMWAHYAQNHEGLVIEFDEEKLSAAFKQAGFGDVDYRDRADESLSDLLYRAAVTGKPRHTYLLRRAVFSAAYYTKTTCWQYEQERRMLVDLSQTRELNGLMLLDIPKTCVKALIAGPHASQQTIESIKRTASVFGCRYLQLKIGRGASHPFFVDDHGNPFLFNAGEILASQNNCKCCGEPTAENFPECPWCRIEESHRLEAARTNPYRLYHRYGLLESYIEQMNNITDGFRKT
jgi:hypothetical protein